MNREGDDAGIAPGAAHRLVDLMSIQEGAIVSRTLVDREAGTVTLFAFDGGQGLSEHTAPYDALVQVLDGSVEITIAGEPVVAHAGEIVVMPAGRPHSLRALEPFRMLLVMIRG